MRTSCLVGRACRACAVIALAVLLRAPAARAQDLGHRMIGTQGLHAGRQQAAGVYVADQLAFYSADELRDRYGTTLPVDDLRLEALGNALGLSVVLVIPGASTYVSFGGAVPLAHVAASSDRPELSVDRFGLGDVFVQPLRLGWRFGPLDLVVGYAFYLPTGLFRLGEGSLSRGHRTHELSIGAAITSQTDVPVFLSALASYDLNETKIGIDIRRGDTVQIQGGAGTTLFHLIDVGAVGAALWQVRDDSGADLPVALQGARDRVFAIGAELGVIVAPIAGRISVRYLRELETRSRPEGQTLVFQLAIAAWQPKDDSGSDAERRNR